MDYDPCGHPFINENCSKYCEYILDLNKPLISVQLFDFLIGGFSPPEGRLARGFKPPAFSRFLFQSAVKAAPAKFEAE
jgi:hypothetical protein